MPFEDYKLTHRGRVMHICVSKQTTIGLDNGLAPGRRQVIIWTNARILLIAPLETNFNEILIKILTFSFKKMHLKVSSAKWRSFRLGLNVLTHLTLGDVRIIFRSLCWSYLVIFLWWMHAIECLSYYRKVSNIRRTKYQNLNTSPLIL